jgi:hypothetical protein
VVYGERDVIKIHKTFNAAVLHDTKQKSIKYIINYAPYCRETAACPAWRREIVIQWQDENTKSRGQSLNACKDEGNAEVITI